METNELKQIWQTLADEKLVNKEIAKENIKRIIQVKSNGIITKLSNKLNVDYKTNIFTACLVFAIMIFATLFLGQQNKHLPAQGYVFLVLAISFYALRALSIKSKMSFIAISFNTESLQESIQKVKQKFKQVSKKETIVTYASLTLLTVFANILINEKTEPSTFQWNSLQGYVAVFSAVYLLMLPFAGKYIFNKKFSGILTDLDNTLDELDY